LLQQENGGGSVYEWLRVAAPARTSEDVGGTVWA